MPDFATSTGVLSFLGFVAILVNLPVIIVIFHDQIKGSDRFKHSIHIIILNLALSDFGIGLTYVITVLGSNLDISDNPSLCLFNIWASSLCVRSTLVLLFFMSLSRFLLIIKNKKISQKVGVTFCAISWGFGLITAFIALGDGGKSRGVFCSPVSGTLNFVVMVFLIILSAISMPYFYGMINYKIRTEALKVRGVVPIEVKNVENQILTTCIAIVTTFWICYIPSIVFKVSGIFEDANVMAFFPVFWLVPAIVDPILYFLIISKYRNAIITLFTCGRAESFGGSVSSTARGGSGKRHADQSKSGPSAISSQSSSGPDIELSDEDQPGSQEEKMQEV